VGEGANPRPRGRPWPKDVGEEVEDGALRAEGDEEVPQMLGDGPGPVGIS